MISRAEGPSFCYFFWKAEGGTRVIFCIIFVILGSISHLRGTRGWEVHCARLLFSKHGVVVAVIAKTENGCRQDDQRE